MEGDGGGGNREKRGREKRRREASGPAVIGLSCCGVPAYPFFRKGGNYATLRNISQSKKCREAGAIKYTVGTGIKGYGKREV